MNENNNLPDDVILKMTDPLPFGLPCQGCYFLKKGEKCLVEWNNNNFGRNNGGFIPNTGSFIQSCTNKGVIFKEVGVNND